MYKIMFVCSGNMCRSPFAATVLKKMLEDRHIEDVEVTSAGTLDLKNCEYDETMVAVAKEFGYEMSGTSAYMYRAPVSDADLILVMSCHHRVKLTQLLPYADWGKMQLFSQFCLGIDDEVPDPFYQTEDVYRKAAEMIVKGCEALADRIAAEGSECLKMSE